jgi:hypothetical protein
VGCLSHACTGLPPGAFKQAGSSLGVGAAMGMSRNAEYWSGLYEQMLNINSFEATLPARE